MEVQGVSEAVVKTEKPVAKLVEPVEVVIELVSGVVKWFNVKSGYGFVNRDDNREDVFVHQSGITRCDPRRVMRSLGDGEKVEFAVVAGPRGHEAINVTGPGGRYAKGSPYSAEWRLWRKHVVKPKTEEVEEVSPELVQDRQSRRVRRPRKKASEAAGRPSDDVITERPRRRRAHPRQKRAPVSAVQSPDSVSPHI